VLADEAVSNEELEPEVGKCKLFVRIEELLVVHVEVLHQVEPDTELTQLDSTSIDVDPIECVRDELLLELESASVIATAIITVPPRPQQALPA